MPNYSYVRLYADDDGVSHFEDVSGEMLSTDFSPPAPPSFISGMWPTKNAFFFSAPPGWDGKWHPVPARQFMSILQGEVEVQVSDGETRHFKPGDLALVEDLIGKGHYTSVPADGEAIHVLVVQIDDE